MRLNSYIKGDVAVLVPEGKITPGPCTGTLDEKLYALLGHGQKKVIIDFAKTSWLGSSAISILLHHNCKFKETGGNLKLANLTKKIQQIIAITKLALVFEVHDTLEDALDNFKK